MKRLSYYLQLRRHTHPYIFGVMVAIVLSSTFSTSCTYYNGDRTGRYLQIIDDNDSTEASYGVDVFRFGYFVQVVIRRYDLVLPNIREQRFNKDTFCAWSHSTRIKGEKFSVQIPNRGRTATLTGTFQADDTLTIKVQGLLTHEKELNLNLKKDEDEPDLECRHDQFLPITTYFPPQDISYDPLAEQTRPLEKPVFSILWVGVAKVNTGSISVFTGTRQIAEESVDMSQYVGQVRGGLEVDSRSLRMDWPAPSQATTYSPSGATHYAIGHPVVINDQNDGGEKFSWLPREEPILATALQNKVVESAPFPHTGHGRAILYVDGSLLELDPSTKDRMSYLTREKEREAVSAVPNPNAHLYVCEIYYQGNNITHVDILGDPAVTAIPLWVSGFWVGDLIQEFPRLFP